MKVFKDTPQEYYMDGYLHNAFSQAKKVVAKDWDMVFIYDGIEGSGKSVKAMQDAFFCDETFDLSRMVFNPEAFEKAVKEAKPFQAVVYDEAYTGLNAKSTMSKINRTLVKMFAEIRQRNLFIFVVMPTFFDLDKYVALWRSRALVHVYTGDNFERGYFAFYNTDRKKDLYINGKKYYNYRNPKPNFIGRFTNHYPIDKEAYKLKKRNSLIHKDSSIEKDLVEKEAEKLIFDRIMKMTKKIPISAKLELLQVSETTYYRKLKEYEEITGD